MITIQASVSKGWLHRHGGFEFNQKYYSDPYFRMQQDQECHKFVKKRFPDLPIYNMEDNLVQAEYVIPDMMLVGASQPNMIIAATFSHKTSRPAPLIKMPRKMLNQWWAGTKLA